MDADMLLLSDIHDAFEDQTKDHALSVVKSIAKFEQTSFMAINCGHPANKILSPDYIQNTNQNLLTLEWLNEDQVGTLDSK